MTRRWILGLVWAMAAIARAQDDDQGEPAAGGGTGPATAVVAFSGPQADAMRQRVSNAISSRVTVLDAAAVDAAASERNVTGVAADGVVGMATALEARLVVQGEVDGNGQNLRLNLVIRAADGTVLANETIRRAPGHEARMFPRRVQTVFDDALNTYTSHMTDAPTGAGSPPADPADNESAASADSPGVPEGDFEPTEQHAAAPLPEDGLPILNATLGLGISSRSSAYLLSATGSRTTYNSGAFPELVLAVELRPFANDPGLARGLFATTQFSHSVAINTTVAGTAISTNIARFSMAGGWMGPITEYVEVGGSLGGGYDGYFFGTNTLLSTAEYPHLRVALRARVRIIRELLSAELELAWRPVLGVGALVPRFGNAWGADGFDFGLGVNGTLLPILPDIGLSYGIRLDYIAYWTRFSGPGNPDAASNGMDGTVRFTIRAGWSFR